jgi:hypothetical protein
MGARWQIVVLGAGLLVGGAARADDAAPLPGRWAIEGALGLRTVGQDDYSRRLRHFGFRWQGPFPTSYSVGVVRAVSPAFYLVADFSSLDDVEYVRRLLRGRRTETEVFSWAAHAAGAHVRLLARFHEGRLNFYLQAGVGVAFGHTRYRQGLDADYRPTGGMIHVQRAWGDQWVWANGVQWVSRRGNGVYLEFRAVSAVLFQNALYDRRQSGGPRVLLGGRWAP